MSAAEGVLTITAMFQDQATAGLQSLVTTLGQVSTAAQSTQSGFTPLNEAMITTSDEANNTAGQFGPLNSAFNETATTAGLTAERMAPLGSAFETTGAASGMLVGELGPLGNIFTEVGAEAGTAATRMEVLPTMMSETGAATTQLDGALAGAGTAFNEVGSTASEAVGRLGPVNSALEQVAQGGLTAKNTLIPLSSEMGTMGTAASTAATQTVGLGTKIGLLGGFIGSTVTSVFSLVTGYTSLEAASVKVDRANTMLETSNKQVMSAQDAYRAAVDKFGPSSRQAQEALVTYTAAVDRHNTAAERASLAQSELTEKQVEYGVQIVNVVSNVAMLGSSLTLLTSKMGLHAAAAAQDATSNIAVGTSAFEAAAGQNALGNSMRASAAATGEEDIAVGGLGLEFAAIAAPIAVALGLFALIETNTFGMGDAFRSTTTVIAVGIDDIANGLIGLWDQFVKFLNNMAGWNATFNNDMIAAANAVIKFVDGAVLVAQGFATAFEQSVVGIVNFFTQDIVNPIIGAWNTLTLGMEQIWNSAVNQVNAIWKTGVSTLVDGVTRMVGQIDDSLKTIGVKSLDNARQNLDQLNNSLKNTSATSGTTAAEINKNFQGISTIKPIQTQVEELSTKGFIPLIPVVTNTGAAFHTFDGLLKEANVTTAEGAAQIVNYYSHGDNLAKLLNSNVAPAIKSVVQQLIASGGQMTDNIAKTLGLKAATDQHTKSVTDQGTALDQTKTKLTEYQSALDQAKASLANNLTQEVATTTATMELYNAQGFVAKGMADAAKAYSDSAEKNQELRAELSNTTSQLNLYNAAVMDGKNKMLEFQLTTAQNAVTEKEYDIELQNTVDRLGFLKTGLEQTTQNNETFYKSVQGDPQALQDLNKALTDLVGGFFGFADAIDSKLGGALDNGVKDFKKSMKDLQTETGVDFKALGDTMALETAAGLSNATKTLKDDLGVMATLIKGNAPNIAAATDEMISKLQGQIQNASPAIKAEWQKIFDDMRTIASEPIPTAASIGKLQQDLKTLNVPAQETEAILAAMPKAASAGVGPLNQLSGAAQQTANNFRALGDTVNQSSGIVTTASGQVVGSIDKTTGAFHSAAGAATDFNTQIQNFGALASVAQVTFENIAAQAQTLVNQLNTSFKAAVAAITPSFGTIASTAQTTWNNIINRVNTTTAAVVSSFKRMEGDISGILNTIIRDIQGFITSGLGALSRGMDNVLAQANTDFGAIERNINTDMTGASRDVQTQVNAMVSSFSGGFSNILRTEQNDMSSMLNDIRSRGSGIISEFNSIGSSASAQVGRVNQLANAINALRDRTVTITTVFRTIGAPPAGFSGGGTLLDRAVSGGGGATGASGPTTQALTVTQPVVVSSPNNNQPIIVQIDGQSLARIVKKNLFGLTGGVT